MNPPDVKRAIGELRALHAATSDDRGAQRVAWSDTWLAARRMVRAWSDELALPTETDPAGNVWITLKGDDPRELVIGGHLDSVPNGGWLDGSLDLLAGLAVLRRLAAGPRPPITVTLVDFADEEGARFGRSIFGSSAVAGALVPEEERIRCDADGVSMSDALARCGVDLERAPQAAARRARIAAYVELHIEQGPVLEGLGLPLGVASGTVGVERHEVTFVGRAAHAGTTPMDRRRDALRPAARLADALVGITGKHGGVSTIGSLVTTPGIATSVVETARLLLDQRHERDDGLAALLAEARALSERFAAEAGVEVAWRRIYAAPSVAFDASLGALSERVVTGLTGACHRLPSGALHDATAMARGGVPTALLFVQSLAGVSHHPSEDTRVEHLEQSILALDALVDAVIARLAAR